MNCSLCLSQNISEYFYQKKFDRKFYRCSECDLLFVQRDKVDTLREQKKHYDHHKNSELTSGYENFLLRLVKPLIDLGVKDLRGLDFGSGPYPMLERVLRKSDFRNIFSFDPIYKNDLGLLEFQYDFVTSCEVVEHFVDVKRDLSLLVSLIKSGGHLVISTALYSDDIDLNSWYYIQDVTHISIFSKRTIEFICENYALELLGIRGDVVIFLKK